MSRLDLAARARRHQALSDVRRLAIVDALRLSDRTPSELLSVTGLGSNLLAFHLDVLEDVGLVSRHRSEGDGRRRYVTLRDDVLHDAGATGRVELSGRPVLFVCSGNSARSPLAAALWHQRTDRAAVSAGADPAPRTHPHAIEVGRRHGLDLSGARPRGYDDLEVVPSVVVSVCDRAREAGLPFAVPTLHWSIPDPSAGDLDRFEQALARISHRIDQLAEAIAA